MPQVWHDGTSEYGARDMGLEDTTSKDGGGEQEKGCLEMLLIIWLPIAITILEVTRG